MGRFRVGALLVLGAGAVSMIRCSCGDTASESKTKKDASLDSLADAPVEAADDAIDEDVVVPGITAGSCGALDWALHYSGDQKGQLSSDEAVLAVVTDAAGNVYATGRYRGDVDFGGGPLVAGKDNRSLFVLELDATGKHVYSRGFGDPSSGLIYAPQATGHALALAPGNGVIVAGSFAGTIDVGTGSPLASNEALFADAGGGCFQCSPDILVFALDADGKTTWAKSFGGPDDDSAVAIAVDAAGNSLVAGSFVGTLDLGGGITATSAGQRDGFVIKLDASGAPKWLRAFGGPTDDGAAAVALDASGSMIVGGSFSGTAQFGTQALNAGSESDGFLMRLDANGIVTSATALGATERGGVSGIAARPAGGYVAVGWARGTLSLAGKSASTSYTDAFVLSVDGAGTQDWAKLFGTSENDDATSVAIAPNGHILVAATVGFGALDLGGGPLTTELSDAGVTLELDAGGAHVCSRRFSATSNDEPIGDSANVKLGGAVSGFAIAADPNSATVFGGSFSGSTDLGQGPLSASASTDALIAKFSAENPGK